MSDQNVTMRSLEQGLRAASLRQQVIAHNIANVQTPGFKRSRVDFEAQLSQAISDGQSPDSVEPTVVQEVDVVGRPDGNNVDIEAEMARMAENQIWYAALTRQISDQFARLRMVIYDGRR
jgi:flagellar basal-body rod protein FlgB